MFGHTTKYQIYGQEVGSDGEGKHCDCEAEEFVDYGTGGFRLLCEGREWASMVRGVRTMARRD